MKFIFLYLFLGAIAAAVNIGAQEMCALLDDRPGDVVLPMMFGTGAGLVVKYVLDKRYIFQFHSRDAAHDTRTFALYAVMGLATTAIFWVCELSFDYLFGGRTMRYAGALLGLSIGYAVKYYLDKRFVFCRAAGVHV